MVELDAAARAAVTRRRSTASRPFDLLKQQQAFGYTLEDLRSSSRRWRRTAQEPVGSMGTDTPLAVLSDKSPLLYNYFKQLFAQVTNPPIDPIREEMVMSAETTIGSEQNLFEETPSIAASCRLKQPILTNDELGKDQAAERSRVCAPPRCSTLFRVGRRRERACASALDRTVPQRVQGDRRRRDTSSCCPIAA